MLFAELGVHERLLKALEKLNFNQPTEIQQALIPIGLAGKDVSASAQTGSGKTAAYLVPILQKLLENPSPDTATRALIMLPTRELALQCEKNCRDFAAFTQLTSTVIVGGSSYSEQKAMLRKNPELVFGTPGRLLELCNNKGLILQDLEHLVLDEADRMLDLGLRDTVLELIGKAPADRQSWLLSATLDHQGIAAISEALLTGATEVSIGHHRQDHELITQSLVLADDPGHKQQLCNWLLANENYEKALVFTNTREQAEQLASFLQQQRKEKKQAVACIHGEINQDQRKRVMFGFRSGHYKILVATDLAARGLDIAGVDLVVNFSVARKGDEHVHRVGRTGRAGHSGQAITLVVPQEFNRMASIERYLNLELARRTIPGLRGRYKGPTKKAIKTADKPKRKLRPSPQQKAKEKARLRHRVQKNIGKRRQPSSPLESSAVQSDAIGLQPIKRR
jgi:ATP-dependent RNA helicase SrmB